ncbi:unnamed protein product [Linum tenue]|uniref:F-box domain-containing protein n=1 Tax=Linum tenue TaxID=586396 RepID=A0AAV0JUC7_9ROSI|nr:unnamed protein product [Linum tenue]
MSSATGRSLDAKSATICAALEIPERENIGRVPVIHDRILIRLPDPRSACRCKIVCQLWRSVISDASFNRRFVSHRQIMTPGDLKSVVLSFLAPMPNGVKDRDALRVLHCDKDLVLCGFWDKACDNGEHSRSYLVCNPFTKQWHEILIRLPDARSAFRCKPVCQLWFSVMSDASFNRRFVSHRQMMTSDDLKSMVLCFLPPHFHHCYGVKDRGALQVLDCDKDLVLCGFRDTDFKDRAQTRSYLVCNPFTKQCYDLPPAPRKLIRILSD